MSYESFYFLCFSFQVPFPTMVWPLVFLLPSWIDGIKKFLKLGLRFTLLYHGQVVIESSQTGPKIFMTQVPCQILIKMSKNQKHLSTLIENQIIIEKNSFYCISWNFINIEWRACLCFYTFL